MVHDIKWYIERARKFDGLDSDRKLSQALGIDASSLSQMKSGKILPSDKTMRKLAGFADVVWPVALQDLNEWRTRNDPASAKVYADTRSILEQVRDLIKTPPESSQSFRETMNKIAREAGLIAALLALLLGAGTSPAQAAMGAGAVYIMENIRRRFLGRPEAVA